MRKEIIAGSILVIILFASLFNTRYINANVYKLSAQISQAQEHAKNGDNETAAAVISASIGDWRRLDAYVHIMLRHDEIDPITDEFYTLLSDIEAGWVTAADFQKLLTSLEELRDMEHLSLSSIF